MPNLRPQELLVIILAILLASTAFVVWLAVTLATRPARSSGGQWPSPPTSNWPTDWHVCNQCRSPVNSTARFCGECGASVDRSRPRPDSASLYSDGLPNSRQYR